MLGAVGGFSGWLWTAGVTVPAAILLAGAVAVVAAAYVAGSRQDIDGTTKVAALVVLAAGLLARMGSIRLASGILALVTLLAVFFGAPRFRAIAGGALALMLVTIGALLLLPR